MKQTFNHINKLKGTLKLPGDKSISHRAVIFSAMAKGISSISNCSDSEDVKSTINCCRELGCTIEEEDGKIYIIGRGFKNFQKPDKTLYAKNSGTTVRLISGILTAQNFESVIEGNESLSRRPMQRIIEPLTLMGAKINSSKNKTLPLRISPASNLSAIEYKLPVASAQVKSAVILAGLHIPETTTIIETVQTRNHTELMLGLTVKNTPERNKIYVSSKNYPESAAYIVPSDISTASFFIVLALLAENAEIIIKNVLLNETRNAIINILQKMGGYIEITNKKIISGEITGDLLVKNSKLTNIKIDKNIIPNIIDEIPILSIAGLFAEGAFSINGAKELRIKETDRINALCRNFEKLGLKILEKQDGFEITGEMKNNHIKFDSYGDHRIAMTFGVLSLLLKNGGTVDGFESVNVSNPKFLGQLAGLIK